MRHKALTILQQLTEAQNAKLHLHENLKPEQVFGPNTSLIASRVMAERPALYYKLKEQYLQDIGQIKKPYAVVAAQDVE